MSDPQQSEQRKVEKLDVESDQDRAARLESLFASMTKQEEGGEGPQLPQERTRPHALPQSDVLARARAFLPQLAAANEDLLARAREDPESVSIENPSGAHVAMDLGVGVFDVKGEQNGVPGNVPVVEGEEWTKGDSSDSDSSSDSSDGEEAEEVQIREARTTKKAEEKK